MAEIEVFPSAEALARAAAAHFVERARESIAANGRFRVALSGGSTPKAMFTLLASDEFAPQVDWSRVQVFWSDERAVLPDHSDSNYYMAYESLLSRVPIPENNVYRIQAQREPSQAAADYEMLLRALCGERPRMDLLFLGMGDDGHTASLFPHTKALEETQRWVVENYVEKLGVWRITFTAHAINAAAEVLFLVSGANKAERLHQVLRGDYQPHQLPSQLVKPTDGKLFWYVDEAAASLL
jgi:6-phosphogluconolactonase